MFGVPDENTNMTRSLEMVERVKIDILEGSIRTPEGFRSVSGTYRSTSGVTGTPRGKIWAIWAIIGRLTCPQGAGAPPTREEAELYLGRGR